MAPDAQVAEVVHRVIRLGLEQAGRDAQGAEKTGAQGVAVGCGALELGHHHRTSAAGLVFHHHGLAQFALQTPAQFAVDNVGHRAGRRRHQQPDGPRILGAGECGKEGGHGAGLDHLTTAHAFLPGFALENDGPNSTGAHPALPRCKLAR